MTERLTAQEAARVLRCHEKTVRRMLNDGRLKGVEVAGRWLIDPADLPAPGTPLRAPMQSRRRPGHPGSLTALVDAMEAAS